MNMLHIIQPALVTGRNCVNSDAAVASKGGTGGSPVCARQKQASDGVTAILTSLKRLAGRQTQPASCRRSPILRLELGPIVIALVGFAPLLARGAAGPAAPTAPLAAVNGPWFKQNARIVFQGDPITDWDRNRNDCPHLLLGQGYQFIIEKVFDDACKRAPAAFWAADGVHPTYSGHQLMADEWVRTGPQFYK